MINSNLRSYPKVSIIIPTWNGLHLLKQSLDSVIVAKESYKGECEIIIIDNGSMDRTVDVLYDYYPSIIVEKLMTNMGFGYACNRGAEISSGELILILNNDVYVPEQIINELVDTFQSVNDVFSVCPETRLWDGNKLTDTVFSSAITFSYDDQGELIQHWMVQDGKNLLSGLSPTAYTTGAITLIDKNKFLNLGGFDHIYGLAYWEDVDICLKAWKRGWASYCTNDSHAWHKISATSGNEDDCSFKKRQMTLNYILLQLVHIDDTTTLISFIFQFFNFLSYLLKKGMFQQALDLLSSIFKNKKNIINTRKLFNSQSTSVSDKKLVYHMQQLGWKSEPVLAKFMKNKK